MIKKKNTIVCASCRFARYHSIPFGFEYACYHPSALNYDNCPKDEIAQIELTNDEL